MNARVLELLKKPEQFLLEDFKLLEAEIQSAPYTQSIRALYLYGVKKHSPQYYEAELSKTAAYTTDKKILYQFINGKINQPIIIQEDITEKVEEIPVQEKEEAVILNKDEEITTKSESTEVEKTSVELEKEEKKTSPSIELVSAELPKEEEEIVEQKDVEKTIAEEEHQNNDDIKEKLQTVETKEEPTMVPEISSTKIDIQSDSFENTQDTTPEEETQPSENISDVIIEEKEEVTENTIKEKKEEEVVNEELSFHEEAPFMSDIKVTQPKPSAERFIPAPQKLNRHEEERKRLLAEVEAKMKAKKQKAKAKIVTEEKEEQINIENQEISFSETASFDIKKEEKPTIETQQEEPKQEREIIEETPVQNTNWKPMSLATHKPDGRFFKNKPVESKTEHIISSEREEQPINTEETQVGNTEKASEQTDTKDIPVMNLSFFSPEIKTIASEDDSAEQEEEEEVIEEIKVEDTSNKSNVPTFINTWQSWLKIDRTASVQQEETEALITEEGQEEEKTIASEEQKDVKDKVIEKFIQEEPKISKLKEDSEYIVRQNKEDVSHLMTETLAKIYTEQRIYAKAIKGYKILIEKHPEKKSYFLEKIEEVKAIRTQTNNGGE